MITAFVSNKTHTHTPHRRTKSGQPSKETASSHLRRGADGADACVALDGELQVGQGESLEGEQLALDTGVGPLHESLDARGWGATGSETYNEGRDWRVDG